jgi:hypothetical protein
MRSTAAAPLSPQGQRHQKKAQRRYGQPAPHACIIAQILMAGRNAKPGVMRRDAVPQGTSEGTTFAADYNPESLAELLG